MTSDPDEVEIMLRGFRGDSGREYLVDEISVTKRAKLLWAKEVESGEPVVIKQVEFREAPFARDYNQRRELQYRAERQALEHLVGDHWVVRLRDTAASQYALVLECMSGGSLDVISGLDGTLKPHAALVVMGYLAGALAELEERRISHGDVKPHNLLLTKEAAAELLLNAPVPVAGWAKLTDFELVREVLGEGRCRPWYNAAEKSPIGSPNFMAPEAFSGNYDAKSDVYSLAMSCWYVAVGETPGSDGSLRERIRQQNEWSGACVPRFEVDWGGAERTVERCLDRDIGARPSARELFEEMNGVLTTRGLDFAPLFTSARPAEQTRRSRSYAPGSRRP